MGNNGVSMGAVAANSGADTIVFVIRERLTRDCIGPQLSAHLPGTNVRLLERPEDLIELGDWCSISLVVLWLNNGDMNFETAFEAALEAAPKRPIAILSDFADAALVSRALTHGVRGYFSSRMSLAELTCAVRFVAAGGTFVPPSVLDDMTAEPPASLQ